MLDHRRNADSLELKADPQSNRVNKMEDTGYTISFTVDLSEDEDLDDR